MRCRRDGRFEGGRFHPVHILTCAIMPYAPLAFLTDDLIIGLSPLTAPTNRRPASLSTAEYCLADPTPEKNPLGPYRGHHRASEAASDSLRAYPAVPGRICQSWVPPLPPINAQRTAPFPGKSAADNHACAGHAEPSCLAYLNFRAVQLVCLGHSPTSPERKRTSRSIRLSERRVCIVVGCCANYTLMR